MSDLRNFDWCAPYNEVDDKFDDSQSEEIERRYAAQIFPTPNGLKIPDYHLQMLDMSIRNRGYPLL